ncbi:MAG: aldose epimerase [Ilumatobacter sp.]|nr:aldose epimerase [Ilumatobacter sp.]
MAIDDDLSIAAGAITVEVDAASGGRIAQITIGSSPLLVGRDDVPSSALAWGCYPMVPWAGRIRNGTFSFRGAEYHLPRNHGDHAMHGVGFTSAWSVVAHEADRLRLELELPADERWPFGGRVVQAFTVEPDRVQCSMAVEAEELAFPVSFGWHPWFRKPDRLEFEPLAMYRRDGDGIAVDELLPVPAGPWDDCFVNVAPVGLVIDGVSIELTSPCPTWVVYDEPEHATCVEPQTGPPDAFNLGAIVLEPGAAATAFFQLRIAAMQ